MNFKLRILIYILFFIGSPALTYAGVCSNTGSARQCMVCACYHEARGDSFEGKVAIVQMILTRTQLPARDFGGPKECGVVFKSGAFAFTKNRTNVPLKEKAEVDDCKKAVDEAVRRGPNGYAYNVGISYKPQKFLAKKARCGRVGAHIFYAEKKSDCPEYVAKSKPSTSGQTSSTDNSSSRERLERRSEGVR